MSGMISKEALDNLRHRYLAGTRVELIQMDDPFTKLKSGDKGTIVYVDDIGTIHAVWDCGSTLGLIWGVDLFSVVDDNN